MIAWNRHAETLVWRNLINASGVSDVVFKVIQEAEALMDKCRMIVMLEMGKSLCSGWGFQEKQRN